MAENREVRSDLFSMLMEDKKNALEVYNALNGSAYDDPEEVEIVTLERGISLTIRNDASFIVDMNLNIYEHQSTYNPNIPLRSLFYISAILKEITKDSDLYGRKRILIPVPKFVVFYNGSQKRPPIEKLKLSDLFERETENPEMEIVCTVYNINPKCNDELLEKCSVLEDYMFFVNKLRELIAIGDEEAVKHTVKYCIEHDILKNFLLARGSEVEKNMAIDMTWERREELIRRDEFNDGFKQGERQGKEQGIVDVFTILDYIIANPTKTDSEVAAELDCDEHLVGEARKRINK